MEGFPFARAGDVGGIVSGKAIFWDGTREEADVLIGGKYTFSRLFKTSTCPKSTNSLIN